MALTQHKSVACGSCYYWVALDTEAVFRIQLLSFYSPKDLFALCMVLRLNGLKRVDRHLFKGVEALAERRPLQSTHLWMSIL